MCGILGGNNKEWNYKKGIESLKHRGPDGQRINYLKDFTLAFARLSIVDLSCNAMQPMFSKDGQVAIVFNGEIYDYKVLKRQLEKEGYKFVSNSDTEVILNLYLKYGEDFIKYIDGMFSIAIYDKRDRKIKLFRDRPGIKPLYYYYDGKNFAFSSELKGIISMCENIKFQKDYTALYDYLTYCYIPDPKTLYKDVFKLPPAHKLIFNMKSKKIEKIFRYWSIKPNSNYSGKYNLNEIQEKLRALIKEAVKKQMIADVSIGCFLSGGVDSSIVTYESMLQNNKIEAFSIGFKQKEYDESKYAKLLGDEIGISLNLDIMSKKIFKNMYKYMAEWYDEPFADTSAFPSFLVSQLASQKVKVVLTGDGGDEVFGGYKRYKIFNNIVNDYYTKSLLNKYKKLKTYGYGLNYIFCDYVMLYSKIYGYIPKKDKFWYKKEWKIDKDYDDLWYFKKYYNSDLPPITRAQYLDFYTYLPGDILTKVDRVTMANSLEARVPLLSKDIIEFSFSLPQNVRCQAGNLKYLLKQSYKSILPDSILYRPKQGFGIPYKRYIKNTNKISKTVIILKECWNY